MKLAYTRGALRDLRSIRSYIAAENPAAAVSVIERITGVAALLEKSPYLGRPAHRGARFLSISGLSYVVIYRIRGGTVEVIAIFHTSRNRRF
jgi:toxin ParE1/3/4